MYTFYQIFIYIVLNLIQSSKEDEWTVIQALNNLAILYLEENKTNGDLGRMITEKIIALRDLNQFVTAEGLNVITLIEKCIEINNLENLKILRIQLEDRKEQEGLFWHFSLFLHIFK